MEDLKPIALVAFRVSLGLLIFLIFRSIYLGLQDGLEKQLLSKIPEKKDWFRFVACSVFGVVINQLLFLEGLNQTSSIHASLIMVSTPILVLLISWMILGEALSSQKLLGIAIGAAGVVWLILSSKQEVSGIASLKGDVFILINACSYGLYLVLVKPLMERYHPLTIVCTVFFIALFAVIPIAYLPFQQSPAFEFYTPQALWSIAYVIIGATVLTYLFNMLALRRVNPSVVSIYIYTQPFIASLIAVGLGIEKLDLVKIASAVLIISGVSLVSLRFKILN